MKSALREIWHLGAIPALADSDRGWRDESPKGERIAAAREARTRQAGHEARAHLDPALRPYFLSRQHDAWIQSLRREGDRFTLTVHDEDLAALAAHEYNVPWQEVAMPFDIVFEGVGYVGWRRAELDDRLHFASEPRGPVEWLADTFIEPEAPGVRWALIYYVRGTKRKDRNHVLFVEAASVRVVERQRQEWRRRFGPEAMELFDRYASVRAEISLGNDPEGWDKFGVVPPTPSPSDASRAS